MGFDPQKPELQGGRVILCMQELCDAVQIRIGDRLSRRRFDRPPPPVPVLFVPPPVPVLLVPPPVPVPFVPPPPDPPLEVDPVLPVAPPLPLAPPVGVPHWTVPALLQAAGIGS